MRLLPPVLPRRSGAPRSTSGTWVSVIGWSYVTVLLMQRILQWAGAFGRWVSIAQALLPYMLFVGPVIVIAAWSLRSWRLVGATVVAMLSFTLLMWSWWFGPSPAVADGGASLSVVTSNVLFDNPDIDTALDEIVSRDADLVLLSEMTASHAERLQDGGRLDPYPYVVDYSGSGGLVVLSKFPVTSTGVHDWQTIESAAVTVDAPIGDVRVIISHPPPPVFKPAILVAELEAIGADVAAVDQTTIVAGDLNTSWVHPPFRAMLKSGDLYDTMSADGQWWVPTWPTDGWRVPFVSLDHVLATDDLAVVDTDWFGVTGSDHRAIFVTLAPAEIE